jgi:hypothetical protein
LTAVAVRDIDAAVGADDDVVRLIEMPGLVSGLARHAEAQE